MDNIYNDDEEISASELNKFTYCNYQWYYERVYGKKYIRELRKDKLEKLGYKDKSKSNFVKGQRFHENYDDDFKNKKQRKIMIIVCLIIIVAVVAFLYLERLLC